MRHVPRLQRGAALVEFALVCALLFLLLLGIAEMGLIFKDQATLAQAAREASRSLSLGSTPTVAANRAISAATNLTLTTSAITLQRSTPDVNGNPTTWITVGVATANPANNDAAAGDFVKATIAYSHPLITSLIFTSGVKTLSAKLIMRRE